MKKIIAAVLAMVMVLCFAACSKAPTAQVVVKDSVNDAVLYEFDIEIKEGVTAGASIEEYFNANGVDYEIYDGDMIGRIGELEQDNEAWTVYWALYYNGDYATVGLWGYVPAEGDLIEISFEESNW